MSYLHRSTHTNGTRIDPKILLSDDPELYRWASIPADCQDCHQPLSALISRPHEKIYALACPSCSGEDL